MWSQAVVSYAASARKDFAVGFFAASTFNTIQTALP